MKTSVYLILISLLLSIQYGSSQTIAYQQDPTTTNGMVKVNFKITNLPSLNSNVSIYGSKAYYRAFVSYGDGNFERIGSSIKPITENFEWSHEYRDFSNSYPFNLLLEARKDDDEPPEDEKPTTVTGSSPMMFVNIQSSSSTINPSYSLSTVANPYHIPSVPIISDPNRKIKLGLSHHHISNLDDYYFLVNESYHALPIAYRPNSASRIMLFYRDIDDVSYTSYESVVPNYYSNSDPSVNRSQVEFNKDQISIESQPSGIFQSRSIIDLAGTDFTNMLLYPVSAAEASLHNNEIQHGELRLTPYFLTSNITPQFFDSNSPPPAARDAEFLVVLYDSVNPPDLGKLDSLNAKLGGVAENFPQFIESPEKFFFQDYDFLTAKKGEPNDPGGLVIEKICKCCNDHIVDFKLTFCNDPSATNQAKGTNIFLESRLDNSGDSILTNIKLVADEIILDLTTGNTLGQSKSFLCDSQSDQLSSTQVGFCYDYNENLPGKGSTSVNSSNHGLGPGECGSIKFSAKIKASNLSLLKSQHVMNYCVKFTPSMDVGEYCRPNEILRDSTCHIKNDSLFCRLKNNPIWDNRKTSCQSDIVSKYKCDGIICKIPWLPPIAIGALIIGLLIYFLKKRKP